MADFSLLLNHPDREEIISKLVSGSSPKELYQWLKLKYPGTDQSHLRLALKLLKEFSESTYLTDYYGQFKKDLVNTNDAIKRGVSQSIINNKTYQERLQEIADTELDWLKMVQGLIYVCNSRVEQVFDTIQKNPTSFKGDNYILRYLSEITMAVERLKKLTIIESADSLNQNITAQALEEQTAFLQEVIRSVLAKIDPDTAMLFMEEFNTALTTTKPPAPITQQDKMTKIKILEAQIIDDDDED